MSEKPTAQGTQGFPPRRPSASSQARHNSSNGASTTYSQSSSTRQRDASPGLPLSALIVMMVPVAPVVALIAGTHHSQRRASKKVPGVVAVPARPSSSAALPSSL
jgi:hypothetical protein